MTSSVKTHYVCTTTKYNPMLISTDLLFWREFCQSPKYHHWKMASMEGKNWVVVTQDYPHYLCGLLIWHGLLCGHLLVSWLLEVCPSLGVFCYLPPHPSHPIPAAHCTPPPIPPIPPIPLSAVYTAFSILHWRRD